MGITQHRAEKQNLLKRYEYCAPDKKKFSALLLAACTDDCSILNNIPV